jgi:hypothetical protein
LSLYKNLKRKSILTSNNIRREFHATKTEDTHLWDKYFDDVNCLIKKESDFILLLADNIINENVDMPEIIKKIEMLDAENRQVCLQWQN